MDMIPLLVAFIIFLVLVQKMGFVSTLMALAVIAVLWQGHTLSQNAIKHQEALEQQEKGEADL